MATILDAYADLFRGPSPDAIRREKLRRLKLGLIGRLIEDAPDIGAAGLGIAFALSVLIFMFVPWFIGAGVLWHDWINPHGVR